MDQKDIPGMEEAEVTYLCPNAPSFSIRIFKDRYQAVNGVLKLPASASKELERMMTDRRNPRHDIRQVLSKVDREAAIAAAKAHMARTRPQAIQGAQHSGMGAEAQIKQASTAAALTGSQNPNPPGLGADGNAKPIAPAPATGVVTAPGIKIGGNKPAS